MRSRSCTTRLAGGTVSWLALGGLGVVLLAFAALIVGGSLHDTRTAREMERSGNVAEAYLRAQDALSREDDVEDVIMGDRGADVRAQFDDAVRDFDAAMRSLERSGGRHDRTLARRATTFHRRYVAAMRDIFANVDDEELVEQIDAERMDPAQDVLRPLLNGTGLQYAVGQLAALDALQQGERRELIAASIAAPLGGLLYVVLIVLFVRQRRRIDRLARAEVERLDQAAHTDSLTGLLNHRALQRDLAEDGPRTMVMLDVVGLKPVNDGQGHLAGDALLQGVAAALREEVAGRGRAYRMGGDEFALLLPGEDADAGRAAVDAVRVRVAACHPPGVRGGVATGDEGTGLLRQASASLLEARRERGSRRAA